MLLERMPYSCPKAPLLALWLDVVLYLSLMNSAPAIRAFPTLYCPLGCPAAEKSGFPPRPLSEAVALSLAILTSLWRSNGYCLLHTPVTLVLRVDVDPFAS